MFLIAFYVAVVVGVVALVVGLAIDMIFYSSPGTSHWMQLIGITGFGLLAWSWWPFWCLVAPSILGWTFILVEVHRRLTKKSREMRHYR